VITRFPTDVARMIRDGATARVVIPSPNRVDSWATAALIRLRRWLGRVTMIGMTLSQQSRLTRPAAPAPLAERLQKAFVWRSDRPDRHLYADMTGWWRDPELLRELGPALADLHAARRPTVVLGIESRGSLLGPLTAAALGVGFVEIRKEPSPATHSDAWLTATTPPDYRDRHLALSFARRLVRAGDRVVLVDDWIATGGQALGARTLVDRAGATWVGVAVVADALRSAALRRDLDVRSLLHVRGL
jgi:adenine phosphoribosyltransferase